MTDGIFENKCAICGQLPFWNGKALVLVLDHINGIRNDNRLLNLRLLCPHCHSQTDTFAGRSVRKTYNCVKCGRARTKHSKSGLCKYCAATIFGQEHRKVKNRPSKDDLVTLIATTPMTTIGRIFGVSDNAVRKWAKTYGIPTKKILLE